MFLYVDIISCETSTNVDAAMYVCTHVLIWFEVMSVFVSTCGQLQAWLHYSKVHVPTSRSTGFGLIGCRVALVR